MAEPRQTEVAVRVQNGLFASVGRGLTGDVEVSPDFFAYERIWATAFQLVARCLLGSAM